VLDHQWASIHSSPPWNDLDVPTIVRNEFGAGRAVYSAAGIESLEGEAAAKTLVGLVMELLDDRISFTATTHPSVWMSVFDQRDRGRHQMMASFLNYQPELPPVPVPVRFSIRPPAGARFTALRVVPEGRAIPFAIGAGGAIDARLDSIGLLAMVIAEYE